MNKNDLRKMQLIQLEMLREVDRVCKENNIKYSIIAGTILGAVRHKGYIPWDDDADIAMIREEYDKFSEICKTKLNNEKFYFQDHKNTEGYRWGYGKFRRKNTTFLREGQEHMPYDSGVFIDIFPMDYVPNDIKSRKKFDFKCTLVRKFLWSEVGKNVEKNNVKKVIYKIMSLVSLKLVFRYYDKLKDNPKNQNSEWVRKLTFPTPNNGEYGYKKKWYVETNPIEFEGYLFKGIKDYDEYLTFKFGNYMELPPAEERKVHTASYYDIDKVDI